MSLLDWVEVMHFLVRVELDHRFAIRLLRTSKMSLFVMVLAISMFHLLQLSVLGRDGKHES